jgi:hypothetical protein
VSQGEVIVKISKSIKSSFLFAILTISVLPLYQNCSNKVDFGRDSSFALRQGEAEIVELSISPKSWENRPKINITAIVDNSNSMEPIQEKVAQALEKSLAPLSEFSGEIQIFTTTQFGNSDGSDKQSVISMYMKNGQISESKPERPYSVVYQLPDSFSLLAENTRAPIAYEPSNLANATQLFGESIRSLGTSGSSKEEGLCSLLRVVEDKSKNSNGAFNAVLVVSNEDDATEFSQCIKEIKYLVEDQQRDAVQNCDSEEDIAAYEECKYKNTTKLEKTKRLTRLTASYSDSFIRESVRGESKSRNILKINYSRAKVEKKYQVEQHSLISRVKGQYKNDGIVSAEKWFELESATQNNSCEVTSSRTCTDSEFNYLVSKNYKIDGKPAELVRESCQITCNPKDDRNVTEKLFEDVGRCSILESQYASSCNGEKNCQINCAEENRNVTYYGYDSPDNVCQNMNSVNQEHLTNEFFASIKLKTHYYDNNNDGLNKIKDRQALNSGSVSCQEAHAYYSVENKNGEVSAVKTVSSFATSVPSTIKNDTSISCDSISSEALKSKFESLASSERLCLKKESISAKSVVENTNIVFSENDPADCDLNEMSASKRNSIPSNIPADQISCSRSSYDKNIVKLCSLPHSRINRCNSAELFEDSVAHCADLASEANNEGGEFTFSCNAEYTGQFTISVWDQQNVTEQLKYVPNGNVSILAEHLKNKLGQFQLASFTTPSPEDPEYANCVSSNPEAFSPGATFEQLVSAINDGENESLASSFSICEEDYSPALRSVVDKVIAQAEYSYRLDLSFNESIYKVYLVDKNGAKSFVGPDKYFVNNGLIHFKDKSLIHDNISSISIQIWRDLLVQEVPDTVAASE